VAAVVVEGRYSGLFKLAHISGPGSRTYSPASRFATPSVVFADSRRFAEEWTYRFLSSALADAGGAV
jgi:hypothetical protein